MEMSTPLEINVKEICLGLHLYVMPNNLMRLGSANLFSQGYYTFWLQQKGAKCVGRIMIRWLPHYFMTSKPRLILDFWFRCCIFSATVVVLIRLNSETSELSMLRKGFSLEFIKVFSDRILIGRGMLLKVGMAFSGLSSLGHEATLVGIY